MKYLGKILCWLGWPKIAILYQVDDYYESYNIYHCGRCGTILGRHDDCCVQFNFYSNHPKI